MYTQAYIQFKMCRERPDNRKKRKGPRPQPAVPSPAAMPNPAASSSLATRPGPAARPSPAGQAQPSLPALVAPWP